MLWFRDSPLIGLTDVYFPHEEKKNTQKTKLTKPQRPEGYNKNNNFQIMGSSQVHKNMHNDNPRRGWKRENCRKDIWRNNECHYEYH